MIANDAESATPVIAFDREVMASLTKLGCNAGTCHGSLHGKGGFRLSLRGQDPQLDYQSITTEMAGRRLDLLDSSQSLILAKPSGDLAHQGGVRLPKNSQHYQAIRTWIERGALPPQSASTNPLDGQRTLQSIELIPLEVWLRFPTKEQQISAMAHWSDGTTSDITAWTRFECSSIQGAKVDEQGLVSVTQSIDTTISALYLGQRASSRLIFLPEQPERSAIETTSAEPSTMAWNDLDHIVNARLQRLGISAEQSAAPELLLRRLYLSTLGRLPRIDEQDAYFADAPETRWSNGVERVLADPAYASLWALKWSDLLRNEPKVMSEDGVEKWHNWLTQSIAQDKPVDAMVMEMITTLGSTYEHPAASFHRTHRDPAGAAESIGQVFLGIRMQCAKCHNHPFDVWTQDDYYGLAAFLSPLERKQVDNMPGDKLDTHIITGDEIISLAEKPAVLFHPGRSKFIAAKGLGQRIQFAANDKETVPGDQPLERLAAWIGKDNRQFARNMANRIWAHAMGRGIVDPPDDFRGSNPASNPELLEHITDKFIEHGYSTRWLMREILNSHTFARSTVSMSPDAERYETALANFAGYSTKRMMAESLYDAILDISGSSAYLERPKNSDQRFRAIEYPSVPKRNAMLRAFGKPERLLDCECERSSDLSLRQSLLLVNDVSIRAQLRDANGNIARWSELPNLDQAIENLYRTGLTRRPTDKEYTTMKAYVQGATNPKEVLEDIAWAIINSKEFLFVR